MKSIARAYYRFAGPAVNGKSRQKCGAMQTDSSNRSGDRRQGVEQPADARIAGGGHGRRTIARDQVPFLDDADAIAERERLAHVVRDDDDCFANPLLNASELRVQFGARERIQCAEWLVHQQDRRIDCKGARHTDPLTLPA
ncbi:MAG TPA: hypothetical protein VGJ78_23685, partial [Vicinamibacterales bacterium]